MKTQKFIFLFYFNFNLNLVTFYVLMAEGDSSLKDLEANLKKNSTFFSLLINYLLKKTNFNMHLIYIFIFKF